MFGFQHYCPNVNHLADDYSRSVYVDSVHYLYCWHNVDCCFNVNGDLADSFLVNH